MKDSTMLRFLKLSYRIYPKYFYIMLLSSFISSIQVIFSAFAISLLMEIAQKQLLETALYLGIGVAGLEGILFFANRYTQRLQSIHGFKLHEAMTWAISQKIMELPFSYLEMPYYIELKKNAEMGIHNMGAIETFFSGASQFFSSVITLIGLGSVLFTFDPWLVVVLAVGFLISFLIMKKSKKMQITFFKNLLPINFRFGYYFDTLLSEKNGKDFRLYPQYDLLERNTHHFMNQLNMYTTKHCVKKSVYDTLISTVRYIQMFIIYSIVATRTLLHSLSITQFTLTVSSALSFSDSVNKMVEANTWFQRACEHVQPFIELMELESEDEKGGKILDEIKTIEFDHVSFAYPHTEALILDDVSFKIHQNEKISIVGLNGAGKTTIVKLICRLYSPSQGSILVNGKNIQEYEMTSYMKQLSSVFQDYKMFALNVYENVSFERDHQTIEKLLKETGIHDEIMKLKNGYASILSKAYDENGIEMSGGQTQKIAIARALAKNSSLLILDEPTSALDPISEAQIYENFNRLSEKKTAIYISHRMSSSIFCDKILVLDHGKVTDFDSHQNLMKKTEGLYFHLFSTQAKNYQYVS